MPGKTTKGDARQEQFCYEYIKDNNATKAAIRAGYSKKTARTQASRLLTKENIQERIEKLKQERNDSLMIDAQWVLREQVRVYQRCMQDEPVRDSEGSETGEYRFEHTGANKALDQIARHVDVRAYQEKEETKRNVTMINISEDLTAEKAAELYKEFIKG